jgi:xanthine dehydrogenase accessory factor
MTTHRAIVDALSLTAAEGHDVVLATAVRIAGSSYGGAGARMVIRIDGSTVGIVSGGCLESDLAEHAREVHSSGRPNVVTYDTRSDDEAAWGLGLGCNGLIDVLLEPLPPLEAGAVAILLEQALESSKPVVLATVIKSGDGDADPAVGAHALLAGDSIETTGDWGDRSALHSAAARVQDALNAGRRGLVHEHGTTEIALEVVKPAVRLVICGCGPDVVPLTRLASQLGWDVTVVDHRPIADAHPERFPDTRLVECAEAILLAECVVLTPFTAAVVMSHHYTRDLDYVRALLASDVAYIGVLGPRARTERMLAEMSANGETADASRLFSPVGIDVGGDGPEGIALSIIAEISAVTSGKSGGHLRDRRGALHA